MGLRRLLIIETQSLNKLKNFKILIFDEYLKHLLNFEGKSEEKYQYYYSINFLKKRNYYSSELLRKMKIYRRELTKCLNKIHNKNFSEKYWGILIDQVIFYTLNQIIIELPLLRKIKKQHPKIHIQKVRFNNFYDNTFDFVNSNQFDNKQSFTRFMIARFLNYSETQTKTVNKFKKKKEKDNLKSKLFRFFFRNYVKIFNCNLVIDSYLGAKRDLIIFLKSFGRILCIPSKFFFNYEKKLIKKNQFLRNQIIVNERDIVDKTFNFLIKDFLPASFVEDFKNFYEEGRKFKNISVIGSAVAAINNDYYKFIAAEILKNRGKLISLQHGGFLDKKKKSFNLNIFEKKYISKTFLWSGKNSIKDFFFRIKKENKIRLKENYEILIYPTNNIINFNFKYAPFRKFHPKINQYFEFFYYLNSNLKRKVKIKPMQNNISNIFKNNFKKKFNIKNNIFINGDKNILSKYKIVIINDLSTPIYELLYLRIPFIVIDDEIQNLNKVTDKKIKDLKKINVLFNSPKRASIFLNENYENINIWWETVLKSKIFKDLNNDLMPMNKNYKSLESNLKNLGH